MSSMIKRRRPRCARRCAATVLAIVGAGSASSPATAQVTQPVVATSAIDTRRSSGDSTVARTADPIIAATLEYRVSGIARTVLAGNLVTFPYGHSQPTLTCTVLRACVIELQSGEIVLSRIAGDTERWEIAPAPAGHDGRTVLIVVKPRDCDITTNLVLATDRRLYDLTLDSPPCKAHSTNPQQPYVRHIRFYYPDETVAQWARPPEPASIRIAPDVLALNFNYRMKKDRKFPWLPAQVFDDGTRVYVKLPDEARQSESPVLFVLEEDGTKTLLNYSVVDGDTYVTDRLFDRAALVAGVGGKEQKVLIERKR